MQNNPQKNIEYSLEAIKKLLILQLYKSGITTKEIGSVLGVSYKTIERIVSKKSKKRKS